MMNRIRHGNRIITALLLAAALVLGSFTALPEKAYAASSADIQVGDFIDIGKTDAAGYTGVPHWRVLDKAEDGSMLMMSEYLWKGNGTSATAGITFFEHGDYYKPDDQRDFRGTKAEEWCNAFEEAVLSDIEGLTILPVKVSDAEFYYEQKIYGSNNKELHYRKADAILYDNKVFFLSAQEAVSYLGEEPAGRVACMPGESTGTAWYLRSTEISSGNNCASTVKEDGEFSYVNADQPRAARPVFWAKFAEGTSFVSTTDESGAKTWTIGEDQTDPSDGDQPTPSDGGQPAPSDAQKAAEEKAKATTSVAVTGKTVNAASINAAITAAGGRPEYVTEIILSKSVKKISKNAFAGTAVKTIVVKTKKLKKSTVKGSLKGSAVTTIKVQVGKTKANKQYVKKYKKIFTKKIAGKKAKVKR